METLSQLVLNSIIAGAIYTLVAIGFNLIFGAVKFFNLAHGVLAAFGGYLVFFLANAMGFNVYLSVPVAVICSGLAGFAFEKIIFLPLRKRKASNMVLLVASLGLMTSFQAILAIIFSSQFQTLTGESARQTIFNVGGGAITLTQVIIAAFGAGITVFLIILLNKTMFGKAVKAISDDEEVAKIVGINTDKVIGRVFFIGSAIAGLSGILSGFDTGIEPNMGMNLLLKGVIASIIGGVGSVQGGVLGAFILGFAENFGIWKLPGQWKDAIAFVLLIIMLLFRPQGLIKR